MAEASTPSGSEAGMASPSTGGSASPGGGLTRRGEVAGGLQTEKGATTIADTVVTKVASIATREVGGVYELGGGTARAVGSVVQRVGIGDQRTQGVSVEVGEKEAGVDLPIVDEESDVAH